MNTCTAPPAHLYKYLPPERHDVLANLRIRFTPPGSFNDPYDSRPSACLLTQVTHQRNIVVSTEGRLPQEKQLPGADQPHVMQCEAQRQGLGEDDLWPEFKLTELLPTIALGRDGTIRVDKIIDSPFLAKLIEAMGPAAATPSSQRQYGSALALSILERHMGVSLRGGFLGRQAATFVGILSLSQRWDSLLMWSHYADCHRGFLLGLSSSHEFLARGDVTLEKEFPPESISESPFVHGVRPVVYTDALPAQLVTKTQGRLLYEDCLYKGNDWAYEQEWRAFRALTPRPSASRGKTLPGFCAHETTSFDSFANGVTLFDIPPDAIAEIVVGAYASASSRQQVARILLSDNSLKHVCLWQARFRPGGFGVVKEPIDIHRTADENADDPHVDPPLYNDLRVTLAAFSSDDLAQFRALLLSGTVWVKYAHRAVQALAVCQVIDEELLGRR
jgi:hypothetical protein